MPSRRSRDIDKDDAFEEAMHLLQHQGGINFREYKPATVMRRIERRMQVRHAPDLANYVRLLDNDRGELAVLRREMLIPVTSFFRDPETFDILAETVVKTIVAGRGENQPIRVWVAGASTGEEAYSLAILFAEAFDRARRWPNVKLFATDVEQQNVEVGGAGVFSEAITAELSPERLERFFYKRGNHFVVKNEIRQSIVFAKHNLLEDPPFTRMDLVSCRNLLIYFRTQAHERALRRIQYALAPGGFLFLGPSETLAELQSDFTAVSSKHKIYRILRHVSLPLDLANTPLVPRAGGVPGRRLGRRGHQLASDAAVIDAGQSMLLRGYAPASLLLSNRFELLHVFGGVGDYLRIAEGNATRESLQATIEELETANEELQATNEELMASNEELQSSNEELQSVNEELYAVNAENQEKIEILNRLNADLDSMAKAAAIATVFVDSSLRLTRFTPEATSLFKIRNGDLGRPIDDFANLLQYPAFIDELHRTVDSGEMLQREIHAANGRVYLARVLPYAVRQGDARGAVATFVDITTLYDVERMQAVLDSLPEHVAVLDPNGVITLVNRAWREFAAANGDPYLKVSGVGSNYLSACEGGSGGDNPGGRTALEGIRAVLEGRRQAFAMEYPCHSPQERRWFSMHVAPIRHPGGGVIVSHINVSQWADAGNEG